MRKLVTVRKIDRIDPIENADAIEVAVIGGWKIVIKKNEFQVGDSVLYFEVDSFLPFTVPEFAFLEARGSKTLVNEANEDVAGHVLKTARLRKQISQGLALPLGWGLTEASSQEAVDEVFTALGVVKYEPAAANPELQVGIFPTQLARKTDSERVQNLSDEFLQTLKPEEWRATEKIDGTSATFIKHEGKLRIAGRNWELSPEGGHPHARLARELKLAEVLPEGTVIQGEIFGEGIQGNPLKVKGLKLLIFSVQKLEGFVSTEAFEKLLAESSVPVYPFTLPSTVEAAVEQVYGLTSLVTPGVQTEGVVWHHREGREVEELDFRPNFKSINAKFLLKHGG